jgi:hypothetical protein
VRYAHMQYLYCCHNLVYVLSKTPIPNRNFAVCKRGYASLNRGNRLLVTDELVKFEKEPVELQDFREITDHVRGFYGIHPTLINKNRKLTTCNRLDLET